MTIIATMTSITVNNISSDKNQSYASEEDNSKGR